jgi:hypothetical protein
MDVSVQHHTPTALTPFKNPDTHFNKVMDGLQSRYGWLEQKKYI